MILFGNYINLSLILFFSVFSIRNFLEFLYVPKSNKIGNGKVSIIIFTLLYFIIAFAVGYELFLNDIENKVLFTTSLTFFMFFHLLRIYQIKHMGACYSQSITPIINTRLITTGLNSKIRHPLYLFYFLEILCMLLVKFNYIALVAVLIDVIITLIRINNEEKLLVEKFGNDYIIYQKQTWKLVPFIY